MSSPNVEELYDCYEIVNKTDEKEDVKKGAYEKILKGVNGDEKEKRLASQFIANFFKLFPQLYEESFNKLLDLCEDENVVIRKQVIQYLSVIAKSVPEYIPKIADTLIQMLITDDNTEVSLIYSALNSVIKLDSKVTLEAIFNQLLTQLDESSELINTFAFKYLNEKFASDPEIKPEIETLVETHGAKMLIKLSGKDEFPLVIGILASLKSNSSVTGRQKLVNEISEQMKLLGKINTSAKFSTLLLNCKQAVKMLSKNVHADDLVTVILDSLNEIAAVAKAAPELNLVELLRCLVDFSNRGQNPDTKTAVSKLQFPGDEGLKTINNVFQLAHERLPEVPEQAELAVTPEQLSGLSEDATKLKEVECVLLATYQLCQLRPDSMGLNEDTLKQFRGRLQFLGRANQLAHKRANDIVAKLTKPEQQLVENRDKYLLVKVTANLQVLVRELFKFGGAGSGSAPSYKAAITPSWSALASESAKPASAAAASTKKQATSNKRGANDKAGAASAPKSSRPIRGNFNNRRRR